MQSPGEGRRYNNGPKGTITTGDIYVNDQPDLKVLGHEIAGHGSGLPDEYILSDGTTPAKPGPLPHNLMNIDDRTNTGLKLEWSQVETIKGSNSGNDVKDGDSNWVCRTFNLTMSINWYKQACVAALFLAGCGPPSAVLSPATALPEGCGVHFGHMCISSKTIQNYATTIQIVPGDLHGFIYVVSGKDRAGRDDAFVAVIRNWDAEDVLLVPDESGLCKAFDIEISGCRSGKAPFVRYTIDVTDNHSASATGKTSFKRGLRIDLLHSNGIGPAVLNELAIPCAVEANGKIRCAAHLPECTRNANGSCSFP